MVKNKMESIHKTVLLQESIEGLNLHDGSIVVDATFGGGGHSLEICKKYKGVKIYALDQDRGAWDRAKSKFADLDCDVNFINTNFRNLDTDLVVDGVLFDLGLSSDQLDNSLRGFSFMRDEPLLMTMKENPKREDLTAMDVVNTWGEDTLANIIYGYGEERFSRKIAKAIVDARQKQEIKTTFHLVEIIRNAIPAKYRNGKIHFATKTFQALRIAVNDELGALSEGLDKGFKILKKGGRMAVISFHSLEDRVVKKFYKEKEKAGEVKLINKKVILPSDEEIKNNKRSRSAKLRILEKNK
jgi:16S rRNA (cytosine1402-N4)-methyltransferase